MMIIDGSKGEGGGQIFRSSLTLAMCLGKSVRIKNIRSGRKKPGLLRQHLTCLNAAQAICAADISGAELGSREVTFVPGILKSGEYHFSVGSAGSTILVFQTIFPALAMLEKSSELFFEGGTHNGMAPSYDFIRECFMPLMHNLGYRFDMEIETYGFYPSGGGRWRVRLYPRQKMLALNLLERGVIVSQSAVVTQAKIPMHVARRELACIAKDWLLDLAHQHVSFVESRGPGNILSLRLQMQNITEVFESIGERGVPAEQVAKKAMTQLQEYLASDAPVGEYLADQLLIPMVLNIGGCFRTTTASEHLRTNIEVIRQFMGVEISIEKLGEANWLVSVNT